MTPDSGVPAGTWLVIVTLQYTLLPAPFTMPLHWFTDVTSCVEMVVLDDRTQVQRAGGEDNPGSPQACAGGHGRARRAGRARVVLHRDSARDLEPGRGGEVSGGLHWVTAGAPEAAEAGSAARPPKGQQRNGSNCSDDNGHECRRPTPAIRLAAGWREDSAASAIGSLSNQRCGTALQYLGSQTCARFHIFTSRPEGSRLLIWEIIVL